MTFLNAIFLVGLAAVTVPVVLHLIHRQSYPDRLFTSLRFFDVTIKHNVIQKRLIDRLLLALRVLALVALMLGLARPFWGGGVGEQRASVVVVLDNSPSMGRMVGGRTLFDAARETARRTLEALGDSDRVALVLSAPSRAPVFTADVAALRRELAMRAGQPTGLAVEGSRAREFAVPGLTTNTEAIRVSLDRVPAGMRVALTGMGSAEPELVAERKGLMEGLPSLRVSSEPGRIKEAVGRAASLLARSGDGDRRVVIVSDMQASEWGAAVEGLEGVSVVVARVDPGAAAVQNLSLDACELGVREAGLGQAILVTATIRNNGSEPVREAKLLVTAGARKPAEFKLGEVPPNARLRVSFPVQVMSKERNLPCTVEVSATSDALAYDNAWNFLVGVRPPVTVLCVNGVPDAVPAQRESFFVMSALGLPGTSGRAETRVDVAEIEPEALEKQSLFQYRVIVLAGVDKLSDTTRTKLRQFVTDGGGLLVFPGREAMADEYNGWGVLPARVLEKKVDAFTYMKTLSDRAASVGEVAERIGTGFSLLTTRLWLKLEPQDGSEVLASLAGGEPALVEGAVGRGHVILSASGCHTADSDWPLRAAFPILLHSMVNHLGAPAQPLRLVREIEAGDGAACMIAPELASGSAGAFRSVVREGQAAWDAQSSWRNDRFLVLPAAGVPGQYVMAVGPEAGPLQEGPGVGASCVQVAVNHADGESRLTALKADQLPALLPGAKVRDVAAGEDVKPLLAGLYSGRDLWRILLVLALVALAIESLVGWKALSQSMG